nr:putative protein FAM90A12P [Peromyscus maniculatus bairdii]
MPLSPSAMDDATFCYVFATMKDCQPGLQSEICHSQVKCRDCGAFGHRSKSRRCPIKCGSGLLVPQPLEAREEKENQDPHGAKDLQTPGTVSQAERDKKLRQHPALHKDRQIPNISPWAPGKKPPQGPTQPGPNPPKKPRLALSKTPEDCNARTVSKAPSPESQSQTTAMSLGRREAPDKSKKAAAQVPSDTEQTLSVRSRAVRLSGRPCSESQETSAAYVVGQPLRMIFARLHGDWWASRYVTADPDLASEKQTSPPETPVSQEKGAGAHSQLP